MNRILASWCVALLLLGAVFSARAATPSWTNLVGGDYTNGANWSAGSPPAIADTARFWNDATYTVTLSSTYTNSGIELRATNSGNVTLSLLGQALNLTNGLFVSGIGGTAASTNTLVFSGGTIFASNLTVGSGSAAFGQFILAGSGGPLLVVSNGILGSGGGTGIMVVSNGTFQANALTVGNTTAGSSGSMTLAGGTNRVNGSLTIGSSASTIGSVWMVDAASLLVVTNTATTKIGSSGFGQMVVSNGTVVLGTTSLGDSAGGTGLVTVVGGTMSISNTLNIGNRGYGSYTIYGGTNNWAAPNIYLGTLNPGAGSLLVTGGWLNATITGTGHKFYIGGTTATNVGSYTVLGGTNIWSGGGSDVVEIGQVAGSTGTVLVAGGYLEMTNSLTTTLGDAGFGQMTVSNGTVLLNTVTIGASAGGTGILQVVGGNVTLKGTTVIGSAGFGALVVSNSGAVQSFGISVGNSAGGSSNWVLVTGSGSAWTNTGSTQVGVSGSGNFLTISNGAALVNSAIGYVGVNASASNNLAIVTDGGSVWSNGTSLYVGQGGNSNVLMILNGGRVVDTAGVVGKQGSSTNNLVVVAGANTIWNNTSTLYVGSDTTLTTLNTPSYNQLIITNGGTVMSGTSSSGYIGGNSNANYNSVLVGNASLWTNGGVLYVGNFGAGNRLVITNGGRVVNTTGQVGNYASATNNEVIITGQGSIWVSASGVNVGSNSTTKGSGRVLVTDGGTLQAANLVAGSSGTGVITNSGGIFQFTGATPTINNNGYGNIVVTNGTVAFLGVSGAAINGQITNISYSGANTLRLDASTNAALSYVFSNNLNFSTLELINKGAMWQGPALLIGEGGTLRASNANAWVGAVLTNQGTVSVINGQLTYLSNVVLNGGLFLTQNGTNNFAGGLDMASGATLTFTTGTSRVDGAINSSGTINAVNANVTFGGPLVISGLYKSDPSTNNYTSNVTVTASGALSGGVGDLFIFQKDFINQSTNQAQFNLSSSAVLFSNSATHLLSLSNSGSAYIGQGFTNFAQVATNFAIGQLSIAIGNRLTLAGNKDSSLTNALYVGWLDIHGIDTNSYASVTNGLVAALNLANINLYYDKFDVRNDWLNANLINDSVAGYNLWGGGLLLPIPEPSPSLAVGAGLALLAYLRRRSA